MFGYAHAGLQGLALEALVPERLRRAHRAHRRGYAAQPHRRPMGIGMELLGRRRDGQAFPVEIGLAPVGTDAGVVTLASIRDISDTRRERQEVTRAHRDNVAASMSQLALESPDHELAIRRILELTASALELPAAAILSSSWHGSGLHVRAATGLSDDAARKLVSILGTANLARSTFDAGKRHVVTSAMLRDEPLATARSELAAAGFPDFAMAPLSGQHEPLGILVALATAPASFDPDRLNFLQTTATLLASAMQRSRTEEHLAHVQRLEAVGQLTGGVAHDFNNLLTVISGNLQLLEAELSGQPQAREIIDSALRAVDKGSHLTRRLLAFARRQPLRPRAVVPKPLLDELGHMLRRTLGETILVEIDCTAAIPDVYADPNELDTALINLALNARDAMPRGGRLAIDARETTLDDADNPWKLPPGRYVVLTIGDTGTGMPPEVLAHAFEPFYTTKESGKGSGLGLSMAYGFATQSGGSIRLDSRLGYGTRVELVLPAVDPQAIAARAAPATSEAHTPGHETILVVEDETEVRTIATRFLGAVGYRVIAAADAREALDQLAANPDVDLLFSDVVLGSGMDGIELAHAARRLRPEIAVLLASGYQGPGDRRREGDAAIAFELLRKPYRREQLINAIRRVLDDG
jgi:PAS domain S-box-containing protein